MRAILMGAALALAACGQAVQDKQDQQLEAQTANNCPAAASTTWNATADVAFTINGAANGADCAQATATISIIGAQGEVAWQEAYPAAQVAALAGATSVEDMQRMLQEWITPAGASPDSTGDLPEWVAGQDYPVNGEFPFYPEDGVSRSAYEALRARDAAMYCYVQGMESVACLAWDNGELEKVGLQTFPG